MFRYIERSLVYPAPSVKRGDWEPRWIDKQDVWFNSADGTQLHGWFVPHPDPKHVVLYAHGNNEHVGLAQNAVLRLQSTLAATVLVFDYRGYGLSAGKPTERGLIEDALAAQQWLAERTGLLANDIVLVGRSLGGGVLTAVAAERGARALVVDATFSRMVDAARYNYPWLPVRLFMRDRYDSVARIEQYHGPFFQSHRTIDEVVPIELAKQLFDRCPSHQKQFYEIADRRHNEPPSPDYYSQLASFLARVGSRVSPVVREAIALPVQVAMIPHQAAS